MKLRPTAAATASITVGSALVAFASPSPSAGVIERYIRFTRPSAELSDIKVDVGVRVPNPRRPAWFSTTLAEIRSSVSLEYGKDDTRWLNQNVANAASDFLTATADLLPGRPHIYSSADGDLIAEFTAANGPLTIIISPTFTLLFAVVDGATSERNIVDSRRIREEVREFVKPLALGSYGDLAAKK